jgi:tripartite-type tricarboxylate transporter receptor subunit TctC
MHWFKSGWSRCLSAAAAVALTGLATHTAQAQGATDKYPSRAVRLVVGFAPGGGNDILARIIGERLAKAFGQPFIIENKPGAGGGLAATSVMSQPPDGYTLLVGASGAMAIAAAVTPNLGYDTLRDFTPISMVATFPLVLVVNAEAPIKSVSDLIAWSKANPAAANYATSSPAFTLATELFKLKTGAEMQRVTYRGSNDSVISVLSKQTTATLVDSLPAIPLVQDGKLRALAVTSNSRVPELPNAPTMAEAGVKDMDVALWTGLFGPSGLPPEILTKLETKMKAIMKDPQVRERLRTLAADAVGNSSAEFAAHIKSELASWSEVATAANVKIEQ